MKSGFKRVFFFIAVIIIFIAATVTSYAVNKGNRYVTQCFKEIDLSGVNKLMIVAHPDDEMIWGGAHLLRGDYLVVCVTAGRNPTRAKEFEKAMQATGDKYIMLGYPDKTFGRRDDWKNCREDIRNDIKQIIAMKNWELIVTHNPEGEYGHQHHKMTNQIVTDVYNQYFSNENNLYYFGKYYSKKNIDKVKGDLVQQNKELVRQKITIIKNVYKSQGFVSDKFGQMFDYEEWTKYKGR